MAKSTWGTGYKHNYSRPSYRSSKKSDGCYVATSVYGSYDCPAVWVLRRYRDQVLREHIFGRIFVKVYYAISPKMVELFGKNKWFNTINKHILDIHVSRLRMKGFSELPYTDVK